jgi:hypothetical protein
MSKSQFVSFVPKTLDNNIHSRDINDDVIATVIRLKDQENNYLLSCIYCIRKNFFVSF